MKGQCDTVPTYQHTNGSNQACDLPSHILHQFEIRLEFPPVEQVLNPFYNVVTPFVIFLPLLHQWEFLIDSCIRLLLCALFNLCLPFHVCMRKASTVIIANLNYLISKHLF